MLALQLHAVAIAAALVAGALVLSLRAGRPNPYLVIPGWLVLVGGGGALLYYLFTGTPAPRGQPGGFPVRLALDYYCWGVGLGVVGALGRVALDAVKGLMPRPQQRKQQ